MSTAEVATASRWQPLTGGTAVWVFMMVEVFTFGLFMLGHAWGWRSEPQAFADSQALLHVDSGVRGTVMLLVGSWFAYQGVLSHGQDRHRASAGWMLAAALTGLAFSVNKIAEYMSPELAGVTLSTNAFWFSYLFLTGLHLLHVIGGVGFLGWLSLSLRRGEADPLTVEAAGAYWHLVDVVWILLFPILYLMHP